MLPALGISMVKPCVVGTTARASKENVRSIGYSIYYTMVNIGGAAGPLIAGWAHHRLGVQTVYVIASLSVFAMFFVVLIFFREPRKAGDAPLPSAGQVWRNFCMVVGKAWLVLPPLGVAIVLLIASGVNPNCGAMVGLGRTASTGSRRQQPLHVVPGALHRILDRFLAAIHQSARDTSSATSIRMLMPSG